VQRGRALALGTLLVAAMLGAGCSSLQPRPPSDLRSASGEWPIGDSALRTHWRWPAEAGRLAGWVVLQHGFTRQCHHLAGLRDSIARQGWAVLCIDLPAAAGSVELARDLAGALQDGRVAPPGLEAPERLVAGGFSAGAVFAARLGAALARQSPEALGGVLLLDPVNAPGFAADLQAVVGDARRPVLAILANPGRCNAQGSAVAPLRQVAGQPGAQGPAGSGGAVTVVRLVRSSTHVDAEGEDTTDLAIGLCRQGPPLAPNVQALRALASAWLASLDPPRRGSPAAGAAGALRAWEPTLAPMLADRTAEPLGPAPAAAEPSSRRPAQPPVP
jgi:hypothetical protein